MNTPSEYPDNVINSDPEDFRDPLSNYDPPDFADDMERKLCTGEIGQLLQITPFGVTGSDTTIEEAVKLMAADDSFSLMIVDDGQLKGVLSERDVLQQVAERYQEVKDKPLSEVMTPEPAVVYSNDPPAKAINLMATGGFRRLPVLDENDHVIGVVGPKRTTAFLFGQL